MWVAQVTFDGKKLLVGRLADDCNISVLAYPVSIYTKKNSLFVYFACNIFGSETNKSLCIKRLKKEKRVEFFESQNDFVVALIKEPIKNKSLYNHGFLYTKPIFIDSNGIESWTIASPRKKDLQSCYSLIKTFANAKLLKLKKENITNVSIASVYPPLTKKQKYAIDLAISNGYYCVPRKVSVKELAKKANLSFSTFQVHLRKAESKLIPYSLQNR